MKKHSTLLCIRRSRSSVRLAILIKWVGTSYTGQVGGALAILIKFNAPLSLELCRSMMPELLSRACESI
jgi:hypothetical protein